MGKGKTKAHKAAGKKKEKRRAIKAAARKALPAKHRLHKLGKKAITPKKKGKAPAPDRFDHKKPLPNIKIPESITSDILDKKELLVAADFTNHLILRYLRKNPKLAAILHTSHVKRSAAYEAMKKWVRQELRVLVGMFVLDHDMKGLVKERTTTILSAHASTKERLDAYPTLYETLFNGKNPEVILDICAGINPCSYEYLGCEPAYYAVDVSPQLMAFVQEWFNEKGIVGKAWAGDVTNISQYPDADTVFLFKATDVLERMKYGYGEAILAAFKKSRVIVSFATQTMGGNREISTAKRTWVERWAEENGRSLRIVDIPNERFYVIE